MNKVRKTYVLKLYVAGNTPKSIRALKTLKNILDEEFQGVYALKIIDVLKNPQLAEEDKILATPTLSKILPPPVRKIIGDLSDRERVLIGLDLLYEELSEEDFDSDFVVATNAHASSLFDFFEYVSNDELDSLLKLCCSSLALFSRAFARARLS